MDREIARQVEEGITRFQHSVPKKTKPKPCQTSPHTKVAVTARNRVHMDSIGSGSSATLDSYQSQEDSARYRMSASMQESGHNPGEGTQGVVATHKSMITDPNQLVRETFQHVDQLQAEEAERIRIESEPNMRVALDLREKEPGDSVHMEGIPTHQLATGGQNLALARYKPIRTLATTAGGAGDPENDLKNPKGRRRVSSGLQPFTVWCRKRKEHGWSDFLSWKSEECEE